MPETPIYSVEMPQQNTGNMTRQPPSKGMAAAALNHARAHRHHLIAIVALSVFVALTTAFMPSGDVEANRQEPPAADLHLDADILAPIEVAAVPVDTDLGLLIDTPQARWSEQRVRSGDNLSRVFSRAGFSETDVYRVVNEAPGGKALGRIFPGQVLAFQTGESGQLLAVRHVISPLETVTYRDSEDGFLTERDIREPEPRETWTSAEISSSLFMAGKEAGLSNALIMDLANIFGGVIDFVQDPRKGDTFHVVYEEQYVDGKKYRDGAIVAASFTNRGQTFSAYRYRDSEGDVGYYSEDGTSMRKAFLLAPVDFTRISSNFNPRRLHPIYKTTRPHRGTDYAAPTGTPVYAAGDGKVIKAGYTRANGNYLFVQHGDRYITRYLHLHQRKVKQGQRVAQGEVIGTVGSTGSATGPHLHYEFLIDGVHRDPRKVHQELPKAKMLAAAELPRFQSQIAGASRQLASLQAGTTRLAMNQADDKL